MVLFTLQKYELLGAALESVLPWLVSGRFKLDRYDNGELNIVLDKPVLAKHCAVLGSIAPPDEQLLAVSMLGHTLKKEGAGKVSALLPYLAYSRQDRDKPGQSLATAWAGAMLKASGFDYVITFDVHSEAAKRLFPMPLISLSTAPIFAEAIHKYQLTAATIVAPDNGAIVRCEAVKAAAGLPQSETPYFEKRRVENGIVHVGPIGEVGRQAVLIDDILDTGTTLVSACQKLTGAGVREIDIMITHGAFTGQRWKELWGLGVKRIFCTDTLPFPAGLDATNVVMLSIIPLLRQQLLLLREQDSNPLANAGSAGMTEWKAPGGISQPKGDS
jgi:ribose-phosphate pyrophosphokinase